jgi:membrane protease YdiL (CAAX protease family)
MEKLTPTSTPTRSPWIELILYLLLGFGGFLLASLGVGLLVSEYTLLTTVLVLLLNFTFFAGSVALVVWLRKTGLWQEIGLSPLRISWKWIGMAAILALVLIPIRAAIAVVVQILVSGSLDSLSGSARMDLLAPTTGPLWLSFLVTFFLGGILVPVAEELYFRGALYTWLRGRSPMWVAMLISSVLFALGHLDQAAVVATSLVIGLVNAWLMERTHSIWVPVTVHIVNNSTSILLLYAILLLQQLFPGTFL